MGKQGWRISRKGQRSQLGLFCKQHRAAWDSSLVVSGGGCAQRVDLDMTLQAVQMRLEVAMDILPLLPATPTRCKHQKQVRIRSPQLPMCVCGGFATSSRAPWMVKLVFVLVVVAAAGGLREVIVVPWPDEIMGRAKKQASTVKLDSDMKSGDAKVRSSVITCFL